MIKANPLLQYLPGSVAIWAVLYGFGSFVSWSFNPGDWGEPLRVVIGIVGLVVGLAYVFIKADNAH